MIQISGGENNANIQPVSKKRTSDICKEVYSTGTSERIQLFKEETYRRQLLRRREVCVPQLRLQLLRNLTQLLERLPEFVFLTESK